MIDKMKLDGKYKITKTNIETGEIKEYEFNNMIMDRVLTQMIETLRGTASNMEIKYLALGTGTATVLGTNTRLVAEIFRTPPISEATNSTTEIQHGFTVLATEAVAQIGEIGIFGGTTASSTSNTGILISRVLWSENKTNSEELSLIYTNSISR